MLDPGLNRHEWESELASLEEALADSPAEALPQLDDLVRRMLEEAGYDLDDPVGREGEEREVVAEYLSAHEIAQASEGGSPEVSPGDVGAAIAGFRALFDYVVAERSSAAWQE